MTKSLASIVTKKVLVDGVKNLYIHNTHKRDYYFSEVPMGMVTGERNFSILGYSAMMGTIHGAIALPLLTDSNPINRALGIGFTALPIITNVGSCIYENCREIYQESKKEYEAQIKPVSK